MEQKDKSPAEIQAAYDAEEKRVRDLASGLLPKEALDMVAEAKIRGIQPYATQVGDQWFVYRIINRLEYQKYLIDQSEANQKLMNDAPNELAVRIKSNLKNEEKLVLKCLLYPRLDEITIQETPAGWVDAINGVIMATSGFNAEPRPIKL